MIGKKRSIATLFLFSITIKHSQYVNCVEKIRRNTGKYLEKSIFLLTFAADKLFFNERKTYLCQKEH